MQRSNFLSRWKQYLKNPSTRIVFILTMILMIATIYTFSRYLLFNEARSGAILDDPLLSRFEAVDLNTLIFFAIYSSLLIGIISFSFDPGQLMLAFQTYTVLVLFRMLAMYLIPLEPPVGCIDLQDPVVFMMGTGMKIVKDLFFSGHTSTAFMLFQVAKNKFLKMYFLMATIVVGTSVILQKAHYTIDVFAGIIFSYASFQLVKTIDQKFIKPKIS